MTNFLNLHGLLFGPGVGYCAQQAAEMSAISQKKKKQTKTQERSPVSPFFLPTPNIPYVLPVPSLKKCSLVSSQHQYEEQPGQQHQPRCLLDRRITETEEQQPCLWSIAAVWFWRWSPQTGWCDNSGRLPVIPACALSVLERHSPNSSPEFQARRLPAVGHSKREWEHTLHTEAGSRKLDSFVLHAPLISGTKGPPVPPAPRVGTWEAGKTELPFHWRTLWLWWVPRGDTAVAK